MYNDSTYIYNAKIILLVTRTVLGAQIVCEASRNGITALNGYLWLITRVVQWRTYFAPNQINTGGYSGCRPEHVNDGLAGSFVVEVTRDLDVDQTLTCGYSYNEYVTKLQALKDKHYPNDPTTYDQRGKFVDEAFDAVFTAAIALDKLARYYSDSTDIDFTNLDHFFGPLVQFTAVHNKLRESLNATSFKGVVGHVGFDDNYDPEVQSNVYQLQSEGVNNPMLVFRTSSISPEFLKVNAYTW